ncbi:MAG: hypothetical protein MJZ11_03945 [Lachnospiraceae bacterium]|nr:hypothetical protein [Lachnospiraceae bacterium]
MHQNRRVNWLIAIASTAILAIVVSVLFDYYYDLNDDVLIKDILSGAYSGEPDAHNNQNLWLFGVLVSGLYKIAGSIPGYGIVLLLFQYGSIAIILDRSLEIADRHASTVPTSKKILYKIAIAISEVMLLITVVGSHLVNVQYTYTVAMLAAAAIAWVISEESDCLPKEYLKKNIPVFLIVFLGFNLRSEMMLLMLPFLCVAYLIRFTLDGKCFVKNLVKYGCTLALIAGLLLISLGINGMAYSNEGWKTFTDFFDARTELYDFQVIPEYEANKDFFESIGLSKEEQILLENYNFGLDSEYTPEVMWKIAEYANISNPKSSDTLTSIKDNLRLYIYRITHGANSTGSDYPYNLISAFFYILIFILLILGRRYIEILNLIVLFVGRTLIWIYMMMGNRMPERITHSLYLVEITILVIYAMLIMNKHIELMIAFSVIMFLIVVPKEYGRLVDNQNLREETNAPYIKLYEYMNSNNKDFYLLDVYSTVAYSEKMFSDMAEISKMNSDLLGGWFTFSPVQSGKLRRYDISNAKDALLKGKAKFIMKTNEETNNEATVEDLSIDNNVKWLIDFYESSGDNVILTRFDSVEGFDIYEIAGK